ncbi:FG-GAP-like repeat-containing protein [Actinacidiphila soli]|uniref:FG-GAP-like repeat-containing protein n=1 Tax=Actinacidiphila soli TaxID=2487275 RepID=UPI000FCA89FD|nr:FG-GAP-like repeat-containing protein [Actinacidiphila soli]
MSARIRSRWTMTALTAVTAACALIACSTGPTAKAATSGAGTVRASVQEDFNGDGYADLVVGAPRGTVGGLTDAGYVTVMYGSAHGLSASRHTVISRATQGIPGGPSSGEEFGSGVSKGDLDGDGYADLVISGHGSEDSVIVWGGKYGLSGGTRVPGHGNLAQTGDFNGDGRPDVALFRTGYMTAEDPLTDAVIWNGPVFRAGKPASVTSFLVFTYGAADVWHAAGGDVNEDGYSDLALIEYVGEGTFMTELLLGGRSGLTASAASLPPMTSASSLAMGDVNGDGYEDLLLGDTENGAKLITVYGTRDGLVPESGWTTITQNTPGVPGTSRTGDAFGSSLSVGDVTGDDIDDVAVGIPGKTVNGRTNAGQVVLLRGRTSGLSGTHAQAFNQNTGGVPGTAEKNDRFGGQVQLLDVNGNGYADLAAAAVTEDSGNGAVTVLRGRPAGLVTDAAFTFGGRTIGAPYAGARFGSALG